MLVSEKKIRSRSCEATIVSMWNCSARYRRSAKFPGAVGTTAGKINANAPVSVLRRDCPKTVKAPPEECRRAAALWGCPSKTAFSRFLMA